MDDREGGEKGSGISMLIVQHDDDDDAVAIRHEQVYLSEALDHPHSLCLLKFI